MGIETHKIEPHWNYLISIEDDLERLARFVEFNEDNFSCYSIEISRVLMSVSAEVDVVCKQLCRIINPDSKAGSINQYRDEITAAFPSIKTFEVTLPRFGLKLTPWHNWNDENGVPDWWTAYNKIKHHRDSEFHQGNLKNALNAVAGLFIMVLHLYKEKAEMAQLLPSLQLFRVTEKHYDGCSHDGYEFGINYKL